MNCKKKMCSPSASAADGDRTAFILRCSLFLSLLAAAGICAGVAYTTMSNSEKNVAEEAFNSLAEAAALSAQQLARQKVYGTNAMAQLMSHRFPEGTDWPFVTVEGYVDVSTSLAELSGSGTQSVMVQVAPDQVDALNAHAREHYAAEGRPAEAGVSEFGFGVWKPDRENDPALYEDGRLPDLDGTNAWGGEDPNLYVLFLHNTPGSKSLLYNLYSEASRGVYIDGMKACVGTESGAANARECYVITDLLKLKARPEQPTAALLFHPIYPTNDPGNFVGFSTVSFDWSTVFTSTIPDNVDGLVAVIQTETTTVTYEIVDGIPQYLGEGDLHDAKYDQYKFGPVDLLEPSKAASSARYTLALFPSDTMFAEFQSNTPVYVAVSLVAVICFVAILFVLYDVALRRRIRQLESQSRRYKEAFADRIRRSSMKALEQVGTKAFLDTLFQKLDKDGSGTIDKGELKEYVGDSIDGKDFEAMWKQIDLDGNGSLEYDEFCHFMAEVGAIDKVAAKESG